MKNLKVWLSLFILSLPLIYHWLPRSALKQPQITANNAIKINVATSKERLINQQIESLGTLINRDEIDVTSEIAGKIAKISFKPGARVKKGNVLIQLDNRIYASELKAAIAKLKLSEINYQRTKQLSARRISSAQELDQALADYQDKQNDVSVKQAQLNKLTLTAPFDGVLGEKRVSLGQFVNVGQKLVTLTANDKLKIEYRVPERYLASLKLGQQVIISSDAYPGSEFKGQVDFISPNIDKSSRSIQVEALIDNSTHKLAAGLFVKVTHLINKKQKVIIVPEESLKATIQGQQVAVIKDNHVSLQTVEIGRHRRGYVEIIAGLKPQTLLVKRGIEKLKEGSLVEIEDEAKQ